MINIVSPFPPLPFSGAFFPYSGFPQDLTPAESGLWKFLLPESSQHWRELFFLHQEEKEKELYNSLPLLFCTLQYDSHLLLKMIQIEIINLGFLISQDFALMTYPFIFCLGQ